MMDMMQWLVDFSPAGDLMLRVTLVLSVGWVLHLLLFRGNPRWRVLLWRGVIVGVIATSALAPCGYWRVSVARPAEAAETSEPRAASTFEGTDVSAGAAREQASVAGGARPESSSGFSHVPAWVREHLAVIILVGWVLGAGVLAASFLGALLRTQRMLSASSPAPERLTRLLSRVARDLGCREEIGLRCSSSAASPFLMGLGRCVIVLPERVIRPGSAHDLPAILAHEVVHLRSRDLAWTLAVRCLRTVFWFHPLAWRIQDAHMGACEKVCDAVAANYVGQASSYSGTLARLALHIVGRVPAVGSIPMARSADIISRLRLLKRKLYTSPLSPRRVAPLLVVGLAALVGLGGLRFVHAEGPEAETSQMRVLHFPKDRSIGVLYLRERGFPTDERSSGSDWQRFGEAIADVEVPAGMAVKLAVTKEAWRSPSPFAGLKGDDIQMVSFLKYPDADDTALKDVATLTGLQLLQFSGKGITSAGLESLKSLKHLKWLSLYSLDLGDKEISHLAALTSLEYLHVWNVPVTDVGVAAVGAMKSLKDLTLGYTSIGDAGLAHIAHLTSLRRLTLIRAHVTGDGLSHLAGLTQMEELYLQQTAVDDGGLVHLKGMKNLKRLRLGGTQVTDAGLVHLAQLKSLEYLELPWYTGISDVGVVHLTKLPSLKELRLGGDSITDETMALLAGLSSLESLDTGGRNITDRGVAKLARLTLLKDLTLQVSPITDAGLAGVGNLKSLEKLHLNQLDITGEGLAALGELDSLTDLTLSDFQLGDAGFSALAQVRSLERLSTFSMMVSDDDLAAISTLSALKSLSIGSSGRMRKHAITDAGLAHLSKLRSLEGLSIDSSAITDAGLKHLLPLLSLRWLYLSNSQVTEEGLSSLKKALPALE